MKRNFLILLISLALLCGGVVEKIGFGSALAQGQLEQEELLERLREVEEEVEYLTKRAKKLTEEVARLQDRCKGTGGIALSFLRCQRVKGRFARLCDRRIVSDCRPVALGYVVSYFGKG